MAQRKRRLAAYLRVSTYEQADSGFGLDVQRETITRAAKALDARIVRWCDDAGKSGALPIEHRDGIAEAITLVDNGEADGIIVRDLDRLAREVTVQEAIIGRVWMTSHAGVYVSVPPQEVLRDDPDDPYRTAMRQMSGVFAGLDRRLIVKRLRDGRTAKRNAGGHATGPTPYGWRSERRSDANPNGALVPDEAEQAALARMAELAAVGYSTREIAPMLTAEGHPTRRGGAWTHGAVGRIIKRDNESKVA